MTFSAQGTVQSVQARTNGDDAVTITCSVDSDTGPQGAIIGGQVSLDVKLNAGLEIPAEGAQISLSGWFNYSDGSRSTATAAEAESEPSGQ